MTSNLEQFILNGFSLNDYVKLVTEDFTFKQAEAKPQYVGNGDSDGEELVEEPHYTNAYFEMMVRVVPAASTDAALKIVGEVMDKLQSCARTEGGVKLEWTPNGSNNTYTWYAIMGELEELPITRTGETAGWFLKYPVLKIKLTCRPFGYTAERVVLAATPAETQMQTTFIEGIKGDVPAEGRMVITDGATKNRRFLEWGGDVVASKAGNPPLTIEGGQFVVAGMAGEASTKAEAVSSGLKVVKSNSLTTGVTVCSTGTIKNVGTYRLKLRCQSTGGASISAAYQVGEGPLTSLPWTPIFTTERWVELDLGEAFLEAAERGEQISQILIRTKATASCIVYIDDLVLVPTRRYATSRGPANFNTPSVLSGFDQFNLTGTSTFTGKVAEIGGTWAGAGDADDFTYITGGHYVQRTALSDTANTPRYAILGSNEYTNIYAKVAIGNTNPRAEFSDCGKQAVMVRYKDVNNWAKLQISRAAIGGGGGGGGSGYNHWYCNFIKKVAGSVTYFIGVNGFSAALGPNGDYAPVVISAFGVPFYSIPLEVTILEDGSFRVGAKGEVYLTGQDNVFATGGALAKGKVGFQDEMAYAEPVTRYYDDFVAFTPEVDIVCNSGKNVEVRSFGTQLQSTTGGYWSPVPIYRGSGFYLDPAGDSNRVNRLAVKMRRNDTKIEPDTSPTDKQTLEVLATERFLAPRSY